MYISENNIVPRIALFLAKIAMVAIEVGFLTIDCLNGANYRDNLQIIFIWLISVIISVVFLLKLKRK